MHLTHARLTYANVMATTAVFVALGGSSYAAITITGRNVKNSTLTGADVKNRSLTGADVRDRSLIGADVKDRTLRTNDFRAGERPRGPQGLPGPAGASGRDGVAEVITTDTGPTTISGTTDTMSLSLPAGSWMVLSHVGGAYNGITTHARLECGVSEPGGSGGDFSKIRVEPNTDPLMSLVLADLNMHAVMTLAAPTVVKTTCSVVAAGTPTFTLTAHKMTAIRATSVARQ